MKIVSSITKWVAPIVLAAGFGAAANAQVSPNQLTIENITYNGSGCPLGTVGRNVAPDRQAFTLTFSDYIAEVDPWRGVFLDRKNCQLVIDLRIPPGWQFSIVSFDYRGFVSIDEGIEAEQRSAYYFQGDRRETVFQTRMRGPLDDNYTFRDVIGIESTNLVWSPCNVQRALSINTSISARNTNRRVFPDAYGLITKDSIDGEIKHKYGLAWRRC